MIRILENSLTLIYANSANTHLRRYDLRSRDCQKCWHIELR
nr:MAG TPA: hypothetical protein [Caudoviricetes sp.]